MMNKMTKMNRGHIPPQVPGTAGGQSPRRSQGPWEVHVLHPQVLGTAGGQSPRRSRGPQEVKELALERKSIRFAESLVEDKEQSLVEH